MLPPHTPVKVWIRGVRHFAVAVHEQFDLRAFPFDVQDLCAPRRG